MDKSILLTGASGVLGVALAGKLPNDRVVALAHSRRPPFWSTVVTGDVTAINLGLDTQTWRRLSESVDVVVHCAASVNMGAARDELQSTNVEGVRRVADFAAQADARLIHVSTAYIDRRTGEGYGARYGSARPSLYAKSKFDGEEALRLIQPNASIVRPSIIVGDSRTGSISEYQGLHKFLQYLIKGRIPFIPTPPNSFIDMIPQDAVADAIVGLVDGTIPEGEYWLTSGERSLTASQLLEILVEESAAAGIEFAPVRIVDPEVMDRLIRPAFLAEVPDSYVTRLETLSALCSELFTANRITSSVPQLAGLLGPESYGDPSHWWRLVFRNVVESLTPARSGAAQ